MRACTLAHISLFLLGRLFALFLAGFPAFEKAESAVGFVALLPVFFSYCERHGGSLSVRNHRFVVLLIRLTHTHTLSRCSFVFHATCGLSSSTFARWRRCPSSWAHSVSFACCAYTKADNACRSVLVPQDCLEYLPRSLKRETAHAPRRVAKSDCANPSWNATS